MREYSQNNGMLPRRGRQAPFSVVPVHWEPFFPRSLGHPIFCSSWPTRNQPQKWLLSTVAPVCGQHRPADRALPFWMGWKCAPNKVKLGSVVGNFCRDAGVLDIFSDSCFAGSEFVTSNSWTAHGVGSLNNLCYPLSFFANGARPPAAFSLSFFLFLSD